MVNWFIRVIYSFIVISLFLASNCSYANTDLPPGFEDYLPQDETTFVNLQFGNNALGEVVATFDDNSITFEDPKKILTELSPYIKKTAKGIILHSLSEPLATNQNRACEKGPKCGFIHPKILGVIFDRNNYRVSLFINPIYLVKHKAIPAKYLKDSSAGLSTLNFFQFGSTGNNDNYHTLSMNHNGFISAGNWNLHYQDNYTYSISQGQDPINQFQFRDFDLNWRQKQYYASVGLQDTSGMLIIPTFQIVGASLQTNTDLVTNLNEQIATPVEVNIIVPSYVDIYRNNTLLDTQYFPPGNYFIDTTSFPSGSYLLRLNIRTLNNQSSTKYVYFVKTSALPLLTLPQYYISYGRLVSLDSTSIFPHLTTLNVLSLENKQRLHKFFGLGEHITLFDEKEAVAELSFMTELTHLSLTLSTAVSNFGDTGIGFATAGSLYGIVLNSYFRQLWIKNTNSDYINEYLGKSAQSNNTNLGTSLSFNWHDIEFDAGLTYTYANQSLQHNIELGATKLFSFGQNNSLSLSLTFNADSTNKSVFLQASWNLSNNNGWYGSVGGEEQIFQDGDNNEHQQNLKLNLGKELRTSNSLTDIGTSVQASDDQQYYSQYISTSNPYFDAIQQLNFAKSQSQDDTISYNLKVGSTLAYSPFNNWGINSTTKQSGILVRVNADEKSQYTVYVDGRPEKLIQNNKSYFIPLNSYHTNNIQIQSHEITLSIPDSSEDIVLYPGNVQTIIKEAKPAILLMGVFIKPDGKILSHATITSQLEKTWTDTDGFGQITLLTGETLQLNYGDHKKCMVDTSGLSPADGVAFLEQIICK
ncbi:TcfC E-set like domain-containing protein [Facilibium subflavum]|uniref:TcfC E-set like domain-containing protein n=1 Tax=Facilibium subflavum TaxID=2219058 RepID=UPI000E64FFB2|nr:TcfC E-set like domain-containing protein [Facilibium subflavum]